MGAVRNVYKTLGLVLHLKSNKRFYATALRNKKTRISGYKENPFVDWRQLQVTAGNGGDGQVIFLQLWCNENAGPSGGDGGNGGHVIFQVKENVKCLAHVKSVYQAEYGERGGTDDCTGKSAQHTIIPVPPGTVIRNVDLKFLADLDNIDDMFIAARGGAGGKGNHHFLSNQNKEPMIAEYGAKGEQRRYIIEMKTIAHAGLIGFPNAGKSTLLRAISRARPKVAAYPFTTLNPHVGMVHYDDYEQIAVADIPGLIPDAHLNRGLGISFLKHIERCLCLLYVIDLSVQEPWEQFNALKYELEMYKEGLSSKPYAVLGNKIDLPISKLNYDKLKEKIDLPVFPISAKMGFHLQAFLQHLRLMYDQDKAKKL